METRSESVAAAPPPAALRTAQNLVICCDGTNNTLTAGIEDTNVLLLYGYFRKHATSSTRLYYDPGVGTPDSAPPTGITDLVKRRWTRIAGLASGRGVYENITEAYRFLMHNWTGPEDRIFCFGFSRGAFTARCVVGMVNMFGVLPRDHEPLLPTLIRIYFSQPPEDERDLNRRNWSRRAARALHTFLARPNKPASEAINTSEEATRATRTMLAEQVRRLFATADPSRKATIHWVGVWDTVESVGLPVLLSRDNPATATFHDKPGIKNVRHALALDEHRHPFLPRLYDAGSSETVAADGEPPRTLKQHWFPGVHCDVGGSYEKDGSGLSDDALVWMVNEVSAELQIPRIDRFPKGSAARFDDLGMPRSGAFPSQRKLRHDALWDTPFWALAGMTVRDLRDREVVTKKNPAPVRVDMRAPGPLHWDGPSVWDDRRSLWFVTLALLMGLMALVVSGRLLSTHSDLSLWVPSDWGRFAEAACGFSMHQLGSVTGWLPWRLDACGVTAVDGLRDPAVFATYASASAAWALCWDFLFIACWGYLLARVSSRAFTWMVGYRKPKDSPPWWLFLGFAPLAAVGADAGENVFTLAALAADAMGSPVLAVVLVTLAGACTLAKLLGLVGCIPFLIVRVLLTFWPSSRVGKVGRAPPPAVHRATTS